MQLTDGTAMLKLAYYQRWVLESFMPKDMLPRHAAAAFQILIPVKADGVLKRQC